MSKLPSNLLITDHTTRGALKQIRGEIDELRQEELLHLNVDVMAVIITVRGALPGLLALRTPISEQLPHFELSHLDRLELYAMALADAHSCCLAMILPNKEPAALATEAVTLRSQLLVDAKVLVRRGIIAREHLRKLTGTRGYHGLSSDLLMLVALFHGHWESIAGRCCATLKELDRAEAIGQKLTTVASHRDAPLAAQTAAAEDRRRAFTLFFRAYTEVRRAVQYLRFHEGDADRIAPALSGKRKGSSKKSRPKAESTDSNKSASPVASTAAESAPSSTAKVGVGLPGSDPFLN